MPRRRKYISTIVPEIGWDIAKSRFADSGDPAGADDDGRAWSGAGSGRGRLRKRRASSTTSENSARPQLSRMTSSRSPCSPVAASVHLPEEMVRQIGGLMAHGYAAARSAMRSSG
jgi:hypothetical protein